MVEHIYTDAGMVIPLKIQEALGDTQIWYTSVENWTQFKTRTKFETNYATRIMQIIIDGDEGFIDAGVHTNAQNAYFIGGRKAGSTAKKQITTQTGATFDNLPFGLKDCTFYIGGTGQFIDSSIVGVVNLEKAYIDFGNSGTPGTPTVILKSGYQIFLNKFSALQKTANEMLEIANTGNLYVAMVDESQIGSSLLTGAGSWSAYYDSSSGYGLQSHIATPTINQISLAAKTSYTDTYSITATNVQTAIDKLVLGAVKCYAGMYAYDKAIPFNITVKDTYHALALVTASDIVTGLLSGWTFNAGRIVDANITSEADTGGKLRIVCSAAHGLSNGDLVVIGKANNAGHNKPTVISVDGTNPTTEFICDSITYVAGAGASAATVTAPAYLKAGTGAAGVYNASFTLDGTASSSNKDWKWELNTNLLPNDNIVSQRLSTNTLASMTSSGNIAVADGDKIWLSGKNITDTSDYTVKNMNINLHRI